MFVQGVSPTSSFPDISVDTGLSQSSLGVPALATYMSGTLQMDFGTSLQMGKVLPMRLR
jgi:hypothetical protein